MHVNKNLQSTASSSCRGLFTVSWTHERITDYFQRYALYKFIFYWLTYLLTYTENTKNLDLWAMTLKFDTVDLDICMTLIVEGHVYAKFHEARCSDSPVHELSCPQTLRYGEKSENAVRWPWPLMYVSMFGYVFSLLANFGWNIPI